MNLFFQWHIIEPASAKMSKRQYTTVISAIKQWILFAKCKIILKARTILDYFFVTRPN